MSKTTRIGTIIDKIVTSIGMNWVIEPVTDAQDPETAKKKKRKEKTNYERKNYRRFN
jgi:hypothetical protein